MKKIVAKTLTVAALAALGALAAPTTRAQDLGDILGQGQDAINKAKDAVDKATNGAKGPGKGGSNKGAPRMDGRPADAPRPSTNSDARPLDVEKHLAAALRKIAPKGSLLLIVSCKAGAGPTQPYTYTSACLIKSAGKVHATSLPALPAGVKAQFVALQGAWQESPGDKLWEVCKATIPFGQAGTFGDENDGQFIYGYKGRGKADGGGEENDNAYKMVTPAQLMAKYQKVNTQVTRDAKASAAAQAREERRERKAAASNEGGDVQMSRHWTCSRCGKTYELVQKPNDYAGGECTGSPTHQHDWVADN